MTSSLASGTTLRHLRDLFSGGTAVGLVDRIHQRRVVQDPHEPGRSRPKRGLAGAITVAGGDKDDLLAGQDILHLRSEVTERPMLHHDLVIGGASGHLEGALKLGVPMSDKRVDGSAR